jgi:tetratricopeptide (TPR) repeat protein
MYRHCASPARSSTDWPRRDRLTLLRRGREGTWLRSLIALLLLLGTAQAQSPELMPPTSHVPQAAAESDAGPARPSPGSASEASPPAAASEPAARAESSSRPLPAQLPLKELTEQGIRQFQQGEYDAAIESFSAAHVLSPNPMFLFNIAQAHRKAGRPREALSHYQLFLRKAPDSPLRPETEAYIALVEAQQQAKQQAAQSVQGSSPHERIPKEPVPVEPRDPALRPVYKRGWFYALLAGSAVAVGLGVGLGVYFGTRPPATTLGIVDPVF